MKINISDQLFNYIELNKIPNRIISLVPSQTEYLYDLGLDNEVIGITKFCVHPHHWFRNKTRIGGTKTVDIEKIRQLNPDIIFANKEENVKDQIDELRQICPVYVSDISTLEQALSMMEDIGTLVGKQNQATTICNQIVHSFQQLNIGLTYKSAYLIWNEPFMTIGGDTFISDMMNRCGFVNMFLHESRYPTVTIDQLNEMDCELLLLSSEPFPFQQKHIELLQSLLPKTKIKLADGEMFSWYGSRLIKAVEYFQKIINQVNKPE